MRKRIYSLLMVITLLLSACGGAKTNNTESTQQTQHTHDTEIEQNQALLEAQQIIENAASYNTTDKIFTNEEYFSNPAAFFLSTDDAEAYNLILADLAEKTGSAQTKVSAYYSNVGNLFTVPEEYKGAELDQYTEVVFNYYKYITVDSSIANKYVQYGTGASFACDKEVDFGHLIPYTSFFLYNSINSEKELSIYGVLTEIEGVAFSDTLLANMPNYKANTMLDYVPGFEALVYFGMFYDDFSTLANHELIFSSAVATSGDYYYLDYYSGKVVSAYAIPVYDKTADLYGLARFDTNGEFMSIRFEEVEESDVAKVEEDDSEATEEDTQKDTEEEPEDSEEDDEDDSEDDGDDDGGGIIFGKDCEHKNCKKVENKAADAYDTEELVQDGYICYNCEKKFDEMHDVCPSCGIEESIDINYVVVKKRMPAQYLIYDLCLDCGSKINYRIEYRDE